MSNKILEYIEDIIHFKSHEDRERLQTLQEEGRAQYVTLEDVGFTVLNLLTDLTKYVDTSQAITEVRLKAIVGALPIDTQEIIHNQFTEAEDDLFITEGEEINYDK